MAVAAGVAPRDLLAPPDIPDVLDLPDLKVRKVQKGRKDLSDPKVRRGLKAQMAQPERKDLLGQLAPKALPGFKV